MFKSIITAVLVTLSAGVATADPFDNIATRDFVITIAERSQAEFYNSTENLTQRIEAIESVNSAILSVDDVVTVSDLEANTLESALGLQSVNARVDDLQTVVTTGLETQRSSFNLVYDASVAFSQDRRDEIRAEGNKTAERVHNLTLDVDEIIDRNIQLESDLLTQEARINQLEATLNFLIEKFTK